MAQSVSVDYIALFFYLFILFLSPPLSLSLYFLLSIYVFHCRVKDLLRFSKDLRVELYNK